jgi:hypothetical protein
METLLKTTTKAMKEMMLLLKENNTPTAKETLRIPSSQHGD